MDAITKLTRARVKLYVSSPFFSYLALHLKFINDNKVPTMGVNIYGECRYNEKFVDSLSHEETKGVLVHEIMHVVFEHLLRGFNKRAVGIDNNGNPVSIFNLAGDICINDVILQNGFQLPNDTIKPSNHEVIIGGIKIKDIDKKSADVIYNELLSKIKDNKTGVGQFDELEYTDGNPSHEKDKGEKGEEKIPIDWKEEVAKASAIAKERGQMPVGMERMIGELFNPKVDWRAMLYKYITKEIPMDYTFNRPSKKSIATGFYMPSLKKEKVDIVISLDTSGSIGQEELTEFISECVAIARSFNQIRMTMIICLDGETPVLTPSGFVKLKDIQIGDTVIGYENGKPKPTKVLYKKWKWSDELYELNVDGKKVVATGDHKFLTQRGYVEVMNLNSSDTILANSRKINSLSLEQKEKCRTFNRIDKDKENSKLQTTKNRKGVRNSKRDKTSKFVWAKIIQIQKISERRKVYDITTETHNFIANGLVTHNCDAKVHDVYEVYNGNIDTLMEMKIKGGGGTDHVPIYKYIEENIPNAKILLNFTDGYTNFPKHESVKTIWILSQNHIEAKDIPFGDIVEL